MHVHDVPPRPVRRLDGFIDAERVAATETALTQLSFRLTGRRLITVTGDDRRKGGVYEILRSALPYFAGATWCGSTSTRIPTYDRHSSSSMSWHTAWQHGRIGDTKSRRTPLRS